jgi:hypothetical protein
MNTAEIKRIPRPKGVTNTARLSTRNDTYDNMIGHYLKGNIPEARTLSAYEFGLLYNIPDGMIQARVKDGLVSGLLQSGDLQKTLEDERLKILSSSLHRIGDSDHQLNRLLAYLTQRILTTQAASPDLIKELNTVIGTQVRLTETSFKAITILNQALSTVLATSGDVEVEEQLDRETILKELETMKLTKNLDQYLEGTPNLEPHNLGIKKRKENNNPAVHEFSAAKEVTLIKIPEEIPILPK